jgi:hypothetical protein
MARTAAKRRHTIASSSTRHFLRFQGSNEIFLKRRRFITLVYADRLEIPWCQLPPQTLEFCVLPIAQKIR